MEEKTYTMPRIGDKAPEFKAVTTQGNINFPSDYSGSWVILFSHPADFTPVCTSEFMTFASMEKQFNEANCKLVGLSVDGLYSHIAWLRTIKDKIEYKGLKNIEVKFPLIEDITMEVAKKYGMIKGIGIKSKPICANIRKRNSAMEFVLNARRNCTQNSTNNTTKTKKIKPLDAKR